MEYKKKLLISELKFFFLKHFTLFIFVENDLVKVFEIANLISKLFNLINF